MENSGSRPLPSFPHIHRQVTSSPNRVIVHDTTADCTKPPPDRQHGYSAVAKVTIIHRCSITIKRVTSVQKSPPPRISCAPITPLVPTQTFSTANIQVLEGRLPRQDLRHQW